MRRSRWVKKPAILSRDTDPYTTKASSGPEDKRNECRDMDRDLHVHLVLESCTVGLERELIWESTYSAGIRTRVRSPELTWRCQVGSTCSQSQSWGGRDRWTLVLIGHFPFSVSSRLLRDPHIKLSSSWSEGILVMCHHALLRVSVLENKVLETDDDRCTTTWMCLKPNLHTLKELKW